MQQQGLGKEISSRSSLAIRSSGDDIGGGTAKGLQEVKDGPSGSLLGSGIDDQGAFTGVNHTGGLYRIF
jgi:hypothetical protein